MLGKLSTGPTYKSRVTAVSEQTTTDPCKRMKVSILDQGDEYFSHVVSTVTFSVLRTIDTDGVQMNFGQREALRALNYGQSIKIAMKFKNRWWESKDVVKATQAGGASRTDRQSRVVVYPSYGLNEDGPGVLMVSYNWFVVLPFLQSQNAEHTISGIKMLLVSVRSLRTPNLALIILHQAELLPNSRRCFSLRYTRTSPCCTRQTNPKWLTSRRS